MKSWKGEQKAFHASPFLSPKKVEKHFEDPRETKQNCGKTEREARG